MGAAADLRRAGIKNAYALLTGGDFEVDAATGRARAQARAWSPDAGNETRGFVALLLDSVLVSRQSADDGAVIPAELLDRTWAILAKRSGYEPKKPAPAAANPTQANALAVIAIVVGALAFYGVVAYLIYRASLVVTTELALRASSSELLRAHADAMNMLDAHRSREAIAGGPLPYDLAEVAIMQRLQAAQDAASQVQGAAIASAAAAPVGVGSGVLIGVLIAGGLWVYFVGGKR